MEKITFNKGESISIGFLLNSEYDMARIQSCSAWVGGKKFPLATIEQMLRCEIASNETHKLGGKYKLILWLDDVNLGVKEINVADVEVSFNNASDNNTSTNTGYDFVFPLAINETAIEAGDVLYNYVKGDSADLPDGIVIDSEYLDDKERLENTSGTNTGDQDLSGLATKLEIESKADLVNGLIPSSQLPSYVDDVIEVANFAALPITGESGKIYITQDDNLTYRWSGTGYAEISKSLALGETSSTAYRGDRGKIAYDHSQIVAGNPHGTTASEVGASPLGHNHSGEGINPDYIVLDEEYTDLTMVALPVGSLFYNVDQLSWLLKTSTTTYLNLGEENTYIAKNGDGVTHLEGQATYVTSGGGNLDVMTLASSANGKIDALLTQNVLHTGNGRGMYCFGGKVRTFPYANVIKSTDNENTWIEGAELYLCSEAGRYSTTKEAAPAKCSVVGKITQRNGANISVSFRPFKAIAVEDLSNVDGEATTIVSGNSFFIKVGNLFKTITETNWFTWLQGKALTWVLEQKFNAGLRADTLRKLNGSGNYVREDGGTIWYKGNASRWFTPTGGSTFASSGTTVTLTGSTQLTSAMIGAKIGVNDSDKRIITAVGANNSCTIDSAFDTNYSGVSDWGVWSKEKEFINSRVYLYNTTGATLSFSLDNFIYFNQINSINNSYFLRNGLLNLLNSGAILFSSTNAAFETKDTGLRRNAAGLLEIFDGTTNGVLRDLKLRSLFADKIIPNSDTTGVVIRNAADVADILVVDTSNKMVGIGKVPSRTLDVAGDIQASNSIISNSGNALFSNTITVFAYNGATKFGNTSTQANSALAIYTKNIEAIRIEPNQRVGFKTTTPETDVDVNGTTTMRDWVYLNNGTHTGDAVGDIRMKNESGVLTFYRCTVGHATKGSGTWVSIHTIG